MSNILNNTTGLQEILEALQTKAAGSGGIDTSDATATADEIFAGETAYANGQKITGTFTIEEELNDQATLLTDIMTLLDGKTLPEGGVQLPTLTQPAIAAHILKNYEAIDGNGNKITGTMPIIFPEEPTITVTEQGLIKSQVSYQDGYVAGGIDTTATYQLTTQGAKTVTPTTKSQTVVASGKYTTGAVTVAGDSNLKAENIKSGVSIFGVAGSYEGESGGGGASIETCTVNITSDSDEIANYMFVTFENNQIGYVYEMTVGSYTSTPVTISNVVCGSIAYIMGTYTFTGFTTNNCEKIEQINPNSVMIKFTADANGTATIHMFDDD